MKGLRHFFFVLYILFFACTTSQGQEIKVVDKNHIKTHVIGKKEQLIDVRTPKEYEAGHIGNALNYNIGDKNTFLEQIATLDKNKPVYLYCKIGGRSGRAARLLKEKGFKKIYDYAGGYSDWVK